MARQRHLLTARTVATLKDLGRHADGGGLYMLVRDRGNGLERLWLFRYSRGRRGDVKEASLSLGPVRDVSLVKARELAELCRTAIARGEDPRSAINQAYEQMPTFGEVADDLIKSLTDGFSNEKHRAQWKMTLGDAYCSRLRPKPVDEITTEDVLAVLKPIWLKKPETASRVRGRIERVLARAKVLKLRDGENPAVWRGHLDHLLPKQSGLTRGHHRALRWQDIPEFMSRLRSFDSVSALALEWTILTACRTRESAHATRIEINRESKVWTIPADRMKARKEHRVPLCDRAIAIFDELEDLGSDWLFPSTSLRKPLSLSAMAECLKGFDVNATVHGFRSSFRDWAGDATSFPKELAEMALAHTVGDKTEQAYRREDALERRRKLMIAWERYCMGRGNITSLTSTKSASR